MRNNFEKIDIDKILNVDFFKRDEITMDLLCCEIVVIDPRGNKTWFFHEESTEWDEVLKLVTQLPNFDHNWQDKVLLPVFTENRTTVFNRKAPHMMKRKPRKNEVGKIFSADGKICYSIVERNDKFHEFYVDSLCFDQDEGIYYWSCESLPRTGIFELIIDAEREIKSQFREQFSN